MTSLDTSKAGTTENMMNLDPRVSHCFPHQFCLKSSNHSQGAITGKAFGSISPWGNTWRHVEVFPLIASIFVKTVGNPGSKGKVNPFTVSRNVQLPGSGWSKKMGYRFLSSDARFIAHPLYNRFFNYPFHFIIDSLTNHCPLCQIL